AEGEVDPRLLVRGDERGVDDPLERHRRRRAPRHGEGEQRKARGEDTGAGDVGEAEQRPDRDDHEPQREEHLSSAGEAWPSAHRMPGGTGTARRRSVATCSAVSRASWASLLRMTRWARTGTARRWTSSGRTWPRPARAAWARAARTRWSAARGEIPR